MLARIAWRWSVPLNLLIVGCCCQATSPANAADPIRRVAVKGPEGSVCNSVVVVDDAALAHTAQLFPVDAQGKLVGELDLAAQAAQTLKNLELALKSVGSGKQHLAKLNVYVSPHAKMTNHDFLHTMLSRSLPAENRPAVSLVVTRLPLAGAMIAMDAVAVVPERKENATRNDSPPAHVDRKQVAGLPSLERAAQVAILPRGEALYVSGQAEPGDTIHDAALATFKGLLRTLEHFQLNARQVVQFKVFLDPMDKSGEVEQALSKLMPRELMPPLVFVEWKAPGDVEIEMIVAAPPAQNVSAGETVSLLGLPWLSSSPNFCRVARVHGKKVIYFPGIFSTEEGDGAQQVRSVFDQLGSWAKEVGTDYEHLAKATYYVSDDDASGQLNKLRPEYYNPKRPPAASKASVVGVGNSKRSFTMDMIAVGVEPKE